MLYLQQYPDLYLVKNVKVLTKSALASVAEIRNSLERETTNENNQFSKLHPWISLLLSISFKGNRSES